MNKNRGLFIPCEVIKYVRIVVGIYDDIAKVVDCKDVRAIVLVYRYWNARLASSFVVLIAQSQKLSMAFNSRSVLGSLPCRIRRFTSRLLHLDKIISNVSPSDSVIGIEKIPMDVVVPFVFAVTILFIITVNLLKKLVYAMGA